MTGKSPDQDQRDCFDPLLREFINPKHELAILADQFPWQQIESRFASLYSQTGQPAKPIRLMVGLLLLQRIYNLSDEGVVEQWIANPYYQYFCGEARFQWKPPCHPTDLVYFRQRIGHSGCEWLFSLSVSVHPHAKHTKGRQEAVSVDTTVQEKNITFPTDAKLYYKAAEQLWDLADSQGISLRQSYRRTLKQLKRDSWFGHHPRRKKKATKALKKMQVRLGRLLRDVTRKMDEQALQQHYSILELCRKVVNQKKTDSHKIYSLHEPEVACIAKGKAHKKYEFGSKVSLAVGQRSGVILAVQTFKGNPHDSLTLQPTLDHFKQTCRRPAKTVVVDRGYRGTKVDPGVEVIIPGKKRPREDSEKRKLRRMCRRRAGIEPVIGHVKSDCRMQRNYLSGWIGDQMNALLACTGYNLRKRLKQIRRDIFVPIFRGLYSWSNPVYFAAA